MQEEIIKWTYNEDIFSRWDAWLNPGHYVMYQIAVRKQSPKVGSDDISSTFIWIPELEQKERTSKRKLVSLGYLLCIAWKVTWKFWNSEIVLSNGDEIMNEVIHEGKLI